MSYVSRLQEEHEREVFALKSKIRALESELNTLHKAFRHIFQLKEGTDSNCKICGCDLREEIHWRSCGDGIAKMAELGKTGMSTQNGDMI